MTGQELINFIRNNHLEDFDIVICGGIGDLRYLDQNEIEIDYENKDIML